MKKIQSQSNTNLIYGNPAVQIPNKMKPRVQVLKSSDDGSDQASQGGDGTLSHLASCLNAFLCWKWSRTVALRVLFVTSIIFAIFICSLVSYLIIRDLEYEVGHQTYESVAASALKAAREITLRKYQAAKVMESVLSFAFPDAEMWPYVGLNGYFHTSREVAALASTGSMGMSVFVQPPEAAAFESFIQEHFDQQGYPPDAGLSDFGFGIYTRDPDSPFADGRVPSRTGNDTSDGGSPYTILAPIMDHSMWNTNALMYDVHSTDTAVDALFECTEHATQNSDFLATMTDAPTAPQKPACTVSTGFKKLISRPDLATLVDQPIYPANDPTTVVGFVGTSIQWIEVLDQIVPDFFDTLVAVISTDSQWHSNTDFGTVTYIIRHGHAVFLGEGDQHDRRFDSSARSIVLNDVAGATKSVHVTLTVYPNSFDQFATKSPLAVSLGFAAVIAICTVIFFVYDFLMQSDINERKVVLEMKRRFVRFISHEIRTPLNTVCMGLELLESELGPHRDRNVTPEASSSSLAPESSSGASVDYWYDITRDIQENASSAVGILNELLKYDKIETGNLELEIGQVLMWDLVAKVVSQFRLQAVNKEVDLSFTVTDNHSDRDPEVGEGMVSESLRELVVVGDPMRLSEVVRNVISNALKFTPIGGLIKVSVEYKKDGLPEKRSWGRKRNFQLTSNSTDQMQASDQSTGDSNSLACFYSFPRAGSILISVTDTGVGMSEHQLSRVFVEGVQFNANRLQAGGGSGLGLCISKGIIERHRGAIVASSAGEGKGCTFSVELPLYDSSCDQFKTESLVSEKLPTMADSADTCPDKVAPTGTGSMAVDMETVPTIEDDRRLEAQFNPSRETMFGTVDNATWLDARFFSSCPATLNAVKGRNAEAHSVGRG
ncbi:Sensor protein kinase WalK (Fragment) [Seminavis robusta]|uniref:histidine kinase n=1 Tax=Seminavis robusta TaxID=568900 RepID=A0A9N8EYM1_9STRA